MERFCYCSKILPNKTDLVREHWQKKDMAKNADTHAADVAFWNHLKMTGFESWLQQTSQGDFMIHCLEGGSIRHIFKGLREQIASGNKIALKLQNFYLNTLGKDYSLPDVEPRIENLTHISLPTPAKFIKRGFIYPLLSHKEEEHRRFRKEAMGEKKTRHEASMQAFGVSHLSTWLQHTPYGNYVVVYTERKVDTPSNSAARLAQGKDSPEWHEISKILMNHTGLELKELSPNVEWLTAPKHAQN